MSNIHQFNTFAIHYYLFLDMKIYAFHIYHWRFFCFIFFMP